MSRQKRRPDQEVQDLTAWFQQRNPWYTRAMAENLAYVYLAYRDGSGRSPSDGPYAL